MIELEPLIFFIQVCNQQIVFELNIKFKIRQFIPKNKKSNQNLIKTTFKMTNQAILIFYKEIHVNKNLIKLI